MKRKQSSIKLYSPEWHEREKEYQAKIRGLMSEYGFGGFFNPGGFGVTKNGYSVCQLTTCEDYYDYHVLKAAIAKGGYKPVAKRGAE